MRYFISAGEASGDLHASHLMRALKNLDPDASFVFLGGDLMAAEAGEKPVIDYRRMAFMGFSEVLRNLRVIFSNLSVAKRALSESAADAVILVDYPSFNLKLAKAAKKLGLPVFYYIAPKVWAWKSWRVKQLRRYVDKILSILPFEPQWFGQRGAEAVYVGNPSVEELDERLLSMPADDVFRRANGLDPRPVIALVPGSRRGEIRNNLPVMDAVAKRFPQFQAVVAAAPGIDTDFYGQYSSLPLVKGDTLALMQIAEVALVTSGTATLECALAATPQVVCYRANGKKLSYDIMKHLIKSPFVSLPNLIAGEEIIPEMLVHLCTVDSVAVELEKILPGLEGHRRQLEGYTRMRVALGTEKAAPTAAGQIIGYLKNLKI